MGLERQSRRGVLRAEGVIDGIILIAHGEVAPNFDVVVLR